jgi:hypothetical protein
LNGRTIFEVEGIMEEAVVAYFNILSQHLSGGTKDRLSHDSLSPGPPSYATFGTKEYEEVQFL